MVMRLVERYNSSQAQKFHERFTALMEGFKFMKDALVDTAQNQIPNRRESMNLNTRLREGKVTSTLVGLSSPVNIVNAPMWKEKKGTRILKIMHTKEIRKL